ncbi:hypothetical protein BCR34DRAFT_488389 [Clohesyomyces aquaticus]|uniref:Rhodopsin domain-containing protein n=1 Tax=Clohesyomyces aquaticus TaxID=1231657 RepID=A0A1Y1ZFE0_9PLEO|nr:hypothetical protein BCR34DRAFT_488389 [Clohesyomyces aquaticus]
MAAVIPIHHPYENEGPSILGATLTVTGLALLTTIARMYVRVSMIRNVGWDDYTMIFAMCLCIAGQGVVIPEVYYGAGKHIEYIALTDLPKSSRLNFISQPIYLIAICVVKISIGFFLLRIAIHAFYRRVIIGIMAFIAFYTTGCFLTVMLQCTNLAVQWDPTAKGVCWSPKTLHALSYTNVALNIATDLLLAVIIPIPMLWNVQMNMRQKASVMAILSLGLFATAACLVKISYLPNYGKTGDWLWDSRNITIWTIVECNVGIISGNLPTMKPLFRKVLGSTYGHGSRGKSGGKYVSKPYGPGTGHHSQKNYNSLGSSKAQEDSFQPYGVDESVKMTKIAGKDQSRRRSSFEESPGKNSTESISWLNVDQSAGKLGGIMKTTEVNVSQSGNKAKSVDDFSRPERKEAHIV